MLIGGNLAFISLMTMKYGFSANILTLGNADFYSYFITKPYYRVIPHSFGVCLAFVYRDILKFRTYRDSL